MKLDKDCIREVLLYVEEHCVFEISKFSKKRIHNVSFYELTQASELSNFTEDNI